MSRLSLFDSPLLLGFDHFERTLNRVAKHASDGYPPYNIERLSETVLRITIAVAGFDIDDIEITTEDNQLFVRGGKAAHKESDDRIFLHRGIANRQFQRNFVLAEGVEITGAGLENGLLNIDLSQPLPESNLRRIEIRRGDNAGKTVDLPSCTVRPPAGPPDGKD